MQRPSIAATSTMGRVLLGLAALLAVIAAVAVSTGVRTHPDQQVQVIHLPPDQLIPLDSAGCPVNTRCQVRTEVPSGLTDAVRRSFPRAELQWRSTTTSAAGQVYRVTAEYLLNGDQDTLLINAECEPGASQRGQRRESNSAQQRSDLAGNQIAELTVHEIVSPGAAGCSSDLIVTVIGDGFGYDDGLQALSHAAEIQVRA